MRLELARTAMFDYRGGLFAPGRLPPEAVPLPFSTRARSWTGPSPPSTRASPASSPAELAVEQALLVALAVAGGIGASARRAGRHPGLALARPGRRPVAADHHLVASLWAATPALPMVQFPQRFNGPLSLCVALAAATGVAVAGSWRPGCPSAPPPAWSSGCWP